MATDKLPDHEIQDPLGEYCRTAMGIYDNPNKQVNWVLKLTHYTEEEIEAKIKEIRNERKIN